MRYVENEKTGIRHVSAEGWVTNTGGAKPTACGISVVGPTGETIVPLIDCGKCRKHLRREGWRL